MKEKLWRIYLNTEKYKKNKRKDHLKGGLKRYLRNIISRNSRLYNYY